MRNPLAELLFVHGGGAESGRLDRLVGALRERSISVWAVNAASGRRRPAPDGPAAMQDLAGALGALADRARRGPPLILGGHSLGGTVAALAACADTLPGAERCAGMVLTSTPVSPLPRVEGLADGAPVGLDLSRLYTPGSAAREDDRAGSVRPSTLRPAWDRLAERLPVLDLPVMFVHGMSDTIVPARHNHAWAGRLKHAEFAGFHGSRHDVLNATGHRRVATTIADFVLAAALDHAAG
ncbi:alpha/beta hydrolase [Actinomadura rugatobispora]|uniref:Alpha/beta hydrolase n=1 Tax=Actinomadura rugatobispora TaxID=1994 RepID=A0ABW1A735_9ACTN|nr:alpha/beta fold hydrolase [Actinomadura rugatobispora]